MTITTELCLYPSHCEKNKENIQPNGVPTTISQIVNTPPESDKTEQDVLERTTPTKLTAEIIP